MTTSKRMMMIMLSDSRMKEKKLNYSLVVVLVLLACACTWNERITFSRSCQWGSEETRVEWSGFGSICMIINHHIWTELQNRHVSLSCQIFVREKSIDFWFDHTTTLAALERVSSGGMLNLGNVSDYEFQGRQSWQATSCARRGEDEERSQGELFNSLAHLLALARRIW